MAKGGKGGSSGGARGSAGNSRGASGGGAGHTDPQKLPVAARQAAQSVPVTEAQKATWQQQGEAWAKQRQGATFDQISAIDAAEAQQVQQMYEAYNKEDPNGTMAQGLRHEAAARAQKAAQSGKMAQDVTMGKAFGKDIIGEGLGRLETNDYASMLQQARERASQKADIRDVNNVGNANYIQDAQSRLKAIADQGLTSEESLAMREKAFQEINQSQQGASRRTQALLGQAGVKGAVAGRQLLDLEQQGMQQKANVSRDLFLESESIKRQGAQNLASFGIQRGQLDAQSQQLGIQRDLYAEQAMMARQEQARQALNDKTSVDTFNISQGNREKDILLQSGLGFAMIGSSNASAAAQAANVAKQSSGGGKTIICTELLKQRRITKGLRTAAMYHATKIPQEIYRGYIRWATPVVWLMRKSSIFSAFVQLWAKPAIYHMAGHETKVGKFIYNVGYKLSNIFKVKE